MAASKHSEEGLCRSKALNDAASDYNSNNRIQLGSSFFLQDKSTFYLIFLSVAFAFM